MRHCSRLLFELQAMGSGQSSNSVPVAIQSSALMLMLSSGRALDHAAPCDRAEHLVHRSVPGDDAPYSPTDYIAIRAIFTRMPEVDSGGTKGVVSALDCVFIAVDTNGALDTGYEIARKKKVESRRLTMGNSDIEVIAAAEPPLAEGWPTGSYRVSIRQRWPTNEELGSVLFTVRTRNLSEEASLRTGVQ